MTKSLDKACHEKSKLAISAPPAVASLSQFCGIRFMARRAPTRKQYTQSPLKLFQLLRLETAMASKIVRAVILGAPGSGKGTISKRIVKNFGFVHIAPGDILRINVQQGTALGLEAKKYMEEGKLVPDEVVLNCVLGKLNEAAGKSWLLDGFPRTVNQAKALHLIEPVDTVISLNVPSEVIIDRVKGRWIHLPSGRVYNVGFNEPKVPFKDDETGDDLVQRRDDNPEIVRRRLELYGKTIKPVIQFYNEQNVLSEFKGRQTDEIWPQIDKFLAERRKIAVSQKI